jgi:hypothetical protein
MIGEEHAKETSAHHAGLLSAAHGSLGRGLFVQDPRQHGVARRDGTLVPIVAYLHDEPNAA